MKRYIRRAAMVAAGAALIVGLTGCGPAPWDGDGGGGGAEPTSSSTKRPTVAPPVPNDLSGGTTQRQLTAGAVGISIDYWSTLSMDRWTHSAIKPINMSMITTITPNDGQKVYLQRATMIAVPFAGSQSLSPLPAQTDSATVNPGYLVLDPYSYSQTFNIGDVPSSATHVEAQFTYDFLVQTTPTSTEYAKQTATDVITVALVPEAKTNDE